MVRLSFCTFCACPLPNPPPLRKGGSNREQPAISRGPLPNPSMRLALSSSVVVVRLSCKSRSMRLPYARTRRVCWLRRATARSTFYPCRHEVEHPMHHALFERVAANPLHTSAPSLNDGEWFTHPAGERAPGPVLHVAKSLSVAPVSCLCCLTCYDFFSCAPCGITPCST